MAQQSSPIKGDWVKLVEEDLQKYNITLSEDNIREMCETQFKRLIKKSIMKHSFSELSKLKMKHTKVSCVKHELGGPQEYLTSSKFTNKMSSLLYNLRCQSIRGIKDNFHNQYKEDLSCPLQCLNSSDTQEHVLFCQGLIPHLTEDQKLKLATVRYQDIFGTLDQQINIVGIYLTLLRIRERLLDTQGPAYPGNSAGPRG